MTPTDDAAVDHPEARVRKIPAFVIALPTTDRVFTREAKRACSTGEDLHTHPEPTAQAGGHHRTGARSGQSLAKPSGAVKQFARQDKGLRTLPSRDA